MKITDITDMNLIEILSTTISISQCSFRRVCSADQETILGGRDPAISKKIIRTKRTDEQLTSTEANSFLRTTERLRT
jgi:hypothetical protein